jgi:uncharacterized protein YmfQ (DUF2313 family)
MVRQLVAATVVFPPLQRPAAQFDSLLWKGLPCVGDGLQKERFPALFARLIQPQATTAQQLIHMRDPVAAGELVKRVRRLMGDPECKLMMDITKAAQFEGVFGHQPG